MSDVANSKDIDEAKRRLREIATGRRAQISAEARAAGAAALAEIDLGFCDFPAGAVISGYHPIGEELDPRPLLARLSDAGHPIVLPVTPGRRERLTFRQWQPGTPLEEGRFGVAVPFEDAPRREPDILLVPLLAFDRRCHRIGYGAGFYDRTLAALRQAGPVTAIGLAFAEQEIDAVPTDRYDQPLDWMLTPDGPRARGA